MQFLNKSIEGLKILSTGCSIEYARGVVRCTTVGRMYSETVAAATGQDNPGAVSEHDVNALAAHQVASSCFTDSEWTPPSRWTSGNC